MGPHHHNIIAAYVVSLAALAIGCSSPPKGSPDDVGGPQYAALEGAATTTAAESAARRSNHHIKTAFVIVMENHSWNQIAGSRSAPYINDVLIPASALAESYTNNNVSPSEPNYIWMEAGDRLGIFDNDGPDQNYRTTKKHLVSLLNAASVPWKTYQQGIDGTRCPLEPQGDYNPKHNPMIFFSDVTDNSNPSSPSCIAHMRPESELATDLANGSAGGGGYVFITPDRCHNMHDACASGDPIRNGDDFLAAEIPKIQASAAYKDGGAIFVTWDEGAPNEGRSIGMLVVSPFARAGYRSTTPFDHSSLLRTMQEVFAVEPFLRGAATATSLGELFTVYP